MSWILDRAPFGGHNAMMVAALLAAVTAAIRGTWSPCGLSMVSSINPMAERSRGHRYPVTVVWFVAGAVVGGLGLGLMTGLLSLVAGWTSGFIAVAVLAGLITAAADTDRFGFALPLLPRQVNERWLGQYRRWVYAAGFGAQIGAGFTTYVMTAGVYLTAVLAICSGSPVWALVMGITFGLVRGLAVLLSARATDPGRLLDLHRRLTRLGRRSLQLAIAGQLLAVLIGAMVLAGWFGAAVVLVIVPAAGLTARFARRSGQPSTRPAVVGEGLQLGLQG